ncbi:MAG: hypothetical protein AMXMBFR12_02430 [Candidatus Babeliales bacterium]
MIQTKSFSHLVLLLLILTIFPTTGFSEPRDAFDDLIAFVDNSPEVCDIIGNTNFESIRTTNKDVVLTLLDNIGVIRLIQENFFLRSNIIRTRSLLDYPWNLPWRHDKDKKAVFVDLFYNQTSRAFFTQDSSNICTYLALTNDGFLQRLQDILTNIRNNFAPDLNTDQLIELLDLFTTFTVQERRLGLMLGGKTAINCWHITVLAPWYYLERNHFVDDRVQQDLLELSEEIFGRPANLCELHAAERRQHELEEAYLISDKFGIGDTRIYADFPIIKKEKLTTRLGILSTIPTAFAWKKGLKGSSLHLIKRRPELDLVQIFDDATLSIAGAPFTNPQPINFAFAVLENLGAMLLESPLGNGGHFGLGTYIRNRSPLTSLIKQNWAKDVTMRSFISLEYLFPATEWRSFRIPVEEALFNSRNFLDTEDQAVVNSNYAFLLEQITNRFIPYALEARVHPGIVFRWSSQLFYEGCDWFGFSFGTDTYVRNKEKLSDVNATRAVKRIIDQYHARYPTAYQAKLAGSIFFKIDKPDKFWTISLFADYTYMNRGIGADFSLTLNTDVSF